VRDTYDLGDRAVYFPNPVPAPPPDVSTGLERPGRYVLFVGRIDANKGLDVLLEAFRRLTPSRPELHLVVVGDGPERRALEARAADLPRVHFTGWVDDRARVHALHRRAAVVACPSYTEAFCYAAAEAMAVGRPVVASAVGGLLDLVEDGRTGLLVPPGDASALTDALVKLVDAPQLADEMGAQGRERIEREFSEAVLVPRLAAMFEAVIAPSRR
jgi:glycosyltransferase involved in cell wall biosynthesis